MTRDPEPFELTLDGNKLHVRNLPRIRDLLSVFSKEELTNALAKLSETMASKGDLRSMGYVQNESTGFWHKLRCRNNADGNPEFFLSDETYSF